MATGTNKDKLKVFGSTRKRAFKKKGGILRLLVRLIDSDSRESNQTISLKQAIRKINQVLRRLDQKTDFENWLAHQKILLDDYKNLIVSVFYSTKTQMERF